MRTTPFYGVLALTAFVLLPACKGKKTSKGHRTSAATSDPQEPVLLLSMAQFMTQTDSSGKSTVQPGPAKLVILTKHGSEWSPETLEDADSRVFHKAECFRDAEESGILTIGATQAHLKLWKRTSGGWRGRSLWNPTFGGKWDRLRDFEMHQGADASPDYLVIGTHDQGVVAVLRPSGGPWEATEIYRQPNTFIHEIELGDLDGDGRPEVYATPSEPNKADVSQGGGILSLRQEREGAKYGTEWVAQFERRHVKEILVADIERDGRQELYASVEAELGQGQNKGMVMSPLEIRRFTRGADGTWEGETVATLAGGVQARVLLQADLDGDRSSELVATTMSGGIWRMLPPRKGGQAWTKQLVDAGSSGFEHAAVAVDFDGDGTSTLYVVADGQDEVNEYTWNGRGFDKKKIFSLPPNDLTWSIAPCRGLNRLR